jgi:hemolysin III
MKAIDEQLDLREEIANTITHLFGILFGIISIPILIGTALQHANTNTITGASIYGVTFLMMFTASTLFHHKPPGRIRDRLRVLDHISIYFLIAGTYTPFILIFVNNSFGIKLLVVLWTLTIVGTIFKIFYTGKFEFLSTFIYLAMGWILFAGGTTFFDHMSAPIITLILAGGVLYTIGVLFYLWRLFAYHHAVWHVFVLCGAICHYTAVLKAV